MKSSMMIAVAFACLAVPLASTVLAADAQPDRVVAMYFHRTQRCPTCQKMGSYAEEAVKQTFAKQLKDGKVEFHYIDFQDAKNDALAKGYKIAGPALVVAKVKGDKVAEYKNLQDIWTKVREKPQFIQYVRENVETYLK